MRGRPIREGVHPGAGQYGTTTMDDAGERVSVALVGRDWRGREIVRHAFSVDATGPAHP